MQKFIVRVVVALVVLCGASLYVYKTNNVSETYENNETKNVNSNMLSMMLETSAGSGEYQKTSASAWPTEGYIFNTTLSKCKNGSNLSWDSNKNQVIFDGNAKDDCYIYFDKIITLVEYVKAQYTGTQGENNLYYHDSTLSNSAEDNSYRYSGSSDTTNNFVCFGYDSTDGSCPTDNLYRIIGVFDNQVKLIKYDYATNDLLGKTGDYASQYSISWGTNHGSNKGENTLENIGIYYWNNTTGNNSWNNSSLNKINLNNNYIEKIGNKWSNKINLAVWKYGGNYLLMNKIVKNAYKNEITSPTYSYVLETKIGLMYVSDYGYAAAPSAWSTKLTNYNNSDIKTVNWMYMGLYEWTITPELNEDNNSVFIIGYAGKVNFNNVSSDYFSVRPCFYLNSNVTYVSGNGTKTEPYIIN